PAQCRGSCRARGERGGTTPHTRFDPRQIKETGQALLQERRQMEIGMVGLGRMGLGLSQRLIRGGHRVIGFDPNPGARRGLVEAGGPAGASSAVAALDKLVATLKTPRVIWLMVPAGDVTEQTVAALRPHLARGDTVIDGGNSNY